MVRVMVEIGRLFRPSFAGGFEVGGAVVRHRTSRYLNNRAENSHRPTRRRERQMQCFKSPRQAQRFLLAHSMIYGHFRPRRHLMTASQYRLARAEAFGVWQQETCARTTL